MPIVFSKPAPVSIPWDINNASYDMVLVDIGTEEPGGTGVAFKADGTKMYIIGTTGDRVYQYSLSTAWLASSATYDSISFSTVGQDSAAQGVFFKPDGTKMYTMGSANNRVYQYTLSTPWAINTTSYDGFSYSVNGDDTVPRGVAFKSDGTKMYVIGATNDRVYQYSLGTAWDINGTVTLDKSLSISAQDINPTEIAFKSDGTKMYVVGAGGDNVYQYTLSVPWDVGSGTTAFDVAFDVSSEDIGPTGIAFKTDGTKMYILGQLGDNIYQYSM